MADEVTEVPSLPMEMIREILAWVPVKPLCRFRCVSKSWNSLTFDPQFVRMHFNKALEHDHVLSQRRRVTVINRSGQVYSPKFDEFIEKNEVVSCNLDEFLTHSDIDNGNSGFLSVTQVDRIDYVSGELVCSSNGLLLLRSQFSERFRLFNLLTRETKVVPECPNLTSTICGFGFDPCTQDYKLVYGIPAKLNEAFFAKFSVYSLRTGCWRVIEKDYPYQINLFSLFDWGIPMNGCIHWLVHRGVEMVVLSFVLADEGLREIPLPPIVNVVGKELPPPPRVIMELKKSKNVYLSVYRECLCLILGSKKELWVMKEYGVRESWTKIRMPDPYYLHTGFRKKNYELLLWEGDGKFSQSELYMYKIEEDTTEEDTFCFLSICEVPRVDHVAVHLESLVSANCFGGITERQP